MCNDVLTDSKLQTENTSAVTASETSFYPNLFHKTQCASSRHAYEQAYLSHRTLRSILAALDAFTHRAVIQCKGMVLLGVMVEGIDPLQEAVRQIMVEERAVDR